MSCRIPECNLPAEPGELCWFHKSPPDPDLEREAMDDLERDRLEAC
jgi:hypothetical protein